MPEQEPGIPGKLGRAIGNWVATTHRWVRRTGIPARNEPRIGLALGGGFARGIAHVGVLRVFEKNNIPIRYIAGVSAGSIVAAAFASGATTAEIERVARSMKFRDVARWTISLLGLAASERMVRFLGRTLKATTFEQMRIPLAVVASDLTTGQPAVFRGKGDVILPIRASCSYPGLFQPVRHGKHLLVDGMVTMDIPVAPLREMGATHVVAVVLPPPDDSVDPQNMLSVVNRCLQILSARVETRRPREASLVIAPKVAHIGWRSFDNATELIEAGQKAALAVLPEIRSWFPKGSGESRPDRIADRRSPQILGSGPRLGG